MAFPILYSTDISTAGSVSGLIGVLRDCLSATVTMELNSPPELEIEYPIDGDFWDSIELFSYIECNTVAGVSHSQYFKVDRIEKTLKKLKIHAYHVAHDLQYVAADTSASTFSTWIDAFNAIPDYMLNDLGAGWYFEASIGTYPGALYPIQPREAYSVLEWIGYITEQYPDIYVFFDNWTVTITDDLSTYVSSQEFNIYHKKNMLSINVTEEAPFYGAAQCYYTTSGSLAKKPIGDFVTNSDYYSSYPYVKFINRKDVPSSSDEATSSECTAYAETWLANQILEANIEVDFVAPSDVYLGDTVGIYCGLFDISTESIITKVVYDSIRDINTKVSVGKAKQDIFKYLLTR